MGKLKGPIHAHHLKVWLDPESNLMLESSVKIITCYHLKQREYYIIKRLT